MASRDDVDDDMLTGRKRASDTEDADRSVRPKRTVADPNQGTPDVSGSDGENNSDNSDDSEDDHDYDGLDEGPEDRKILSKMSELEREMVLSERAEKRHIQLETNAFAGITTSAAQSESSMRPKRSAPQLRAMSPAEASPPPAPSRNLPRPPAPPPPPPVSDVSDDKYSHGGSQDDDQDDLFDEPQDLRRSARGRTDAKSSKAETLQIMKERRQKTEELAQGLDHAVSDNDMSETSERGMDVDKEQGYDMDDEDQEASFHEILTMHVRRSTILEWLASPLLEETLPGCLVRVSVGLSSAQQVYVISPVRDIVVSERYDLSPGAAGTSDKHLEIWTGHRYQKVPVTLVSNSAITAEEFNVFHESRANRGTDQIQLSEVNRVAAKLKAALSYTLTNDDLHRIVREKREKGQVKGSLTVERKRLANQVNVLRANGEHDKADRLVAKMETMLVSMTQKVTAVKGLGDLNKRAKANNFLGLNAHHDPNQQKSKLGSAAVHDPYKRRATRPVQYWSTSSVAGAKVEASEELSKDVVDAEESMAPHAVLCTIRLDVDKSLLEEVRPNSLMAKRLLGPRWQVNSDTISIPSNTAGKMLLSLDDYKKQVFTTQ